MKIPTSFEMAIQAAADRYAADAAYAEYVKSLEMDHPAARQPYDLDLKANPPEKGAASPPAIME